MRQFRTPFSLAYWRQAAAEIKNPRVLVWAALIVAVRVAVKSIAIPVGQSLNITIGFLPNALGSMVYGPVVALLAGAVSDVIGALLFPMGAFFPPFTLVEMLGSLLFALFLYRAPLKFWRIALSRLSVNLLCNLLLTPIFLAWMSGRAAVLVSAPRIAKNLLLFPAETLLLALFLGAMLPELKRLRLTHSEQTAEKPSARHFALLAILLAVSAIAIAAYYRYFAVA